MIEYTENEIVCATTKTENTGTDTGKVGVGSAVAGAIDTASTLVEFRDHYGDDWFRSGELHSLLGIQEVEKDTNTIIQNMVVKETELERQVIVHTEILGWVKWFLHIIEQLYMLVRVSVCGVVVKSQHVTGNKVMLALMFNY